ncbi:metallopeptidase TldD-related protein [Desulfosporosinus sp. SYSU MS00001]|uniref:metallopeptidase TldD-related protein n=1 Tax=Desulfosporosinus sp. SYSU MS00001 TaxID=3416284 RepID=UPI003CF5FBFF
MKLVAQLEDLFYRYQQAPQDENLRLSAWRLLVNESQVVSLGIKDNSPGGVYTPPSYRQKESGEVFLVWADGTCSEAIVQLQPQSTAEFWEQKMQQWKQAAYTDPEASHIPAPEPLPLVAVEDRTVREIIEGDDDVIFDLAKQWLEEKPDRAKVQGSIQAAWGYRNVRTSTGLAVTYQQSQFVSWFSFDSLVGGGFAKRRLILPEEQKKLWAQTVKRYEALAGEAPAVNPETQVIFAPAMTEELLGQFIVPNFSGERVIEGQGAFSKENFETHKEVFHPQFSLTIDPLQPLELGSYMVTSEGVPAVQTTLVQEGKLQTPFLRVKDALRWGLKPTGLPHGAAGLYLRHTVEETWDKILSTIEDGVLILSVLGLHTQDAVAGSYSLSAPHSLRIIKGEIVGRVDVKLSGNFFRDLAAATTRLGRSDLSLHPYLVVRTGVQKL